MIEADLQGTTLVVSGDGISDFRAYAPATTAIRINGQPASATLLDGVVIYPALPPPPPPHAGTPDAGTPDAGTPDAGTPDAGTPDAGTPDTGDPGSDGGTYTDGGTIGPIDSDPGDLEPDGGTAQPDGGFAVGPPPTSGSSFPHGGFGCSSGGAAMGLEVGVLLALAGLRRRRRG